MRSVIVLGIIAAVVICVPPAEAESPAPPTPFTFLRNSGTPSERPSLADRESIQLRRDGDTFKDRETGEKYQVTEAVGTMRIKNLQTGESVDFDVSGRDLTNKANGRKFRLKSDASTITITRRD